MVDNYDTIRTIENTMRLSDAINILKTIRDTKGDEFENIDVIVNELAIFRCYLRNEFDNVHLISRYKQ